MDELNFDGKIIFAFNSAEWDTQMTVEDDKGLTANRKWILSWEKFVLESGQPVAEKDYSGDYFIRTRFNNYICATSGNIASSQSNKEACTLFKIRFNRVRGGRNAYCILSKDLNRYVTAESDVSRRVTCNREVCSVWEEFYIDEENGNNVVLFTSAEWKGFMTAENDRSLTANRKTNIDWERFVLEKSPVDFSGEYFIRTRFNSYICANNGLISSSQTSKVACAQL